MKRIKIIARCKVKNQHNEVYSDDELKLLNSYCEEIIEVEDNYDACQVDKLFREQHPETNKWDVEIIEL